MKRYNIEDTVNFYSPVSYTHLDVYKRQEDWGEGYDHVTICCTCENQNRADFRLPAFLNLPIRHRTLIHEPMLEQIEIRSYLATGLIEQVTCGGESGPEARICDYAWILDTMQQCREYDVPFWFKQTGANFKKGNRVYLSLIHI